MIILGLCVGDVDRWLFISYMMRFGIVRIILYLCCAIFGGVICMWSFIDLSCLCCVVCMSVVVMGCLGCGAIMR